MKTFDLTFNGAVLPEFDPGQVKQDFARLFSIDDAGLVEKLFCGKPVILRSDLDRKTAAEYFRKITLLGSEATLQPSGEHHPGDAILRLEQHNGGAPRIIILEQDPMADQGAIDQNWPVSAARRKHEEYCEEADNRTPEEATGTGDTGADLGKKGSREGSTPVQLSNEETACSAPDNKVPGGPADAASNKEPDRLRSLAARAREKSRAESARLQRRMDQFNRIAQEELARISEMHSAARDQADRKTAELQVLSEQTRRTAAQDMARIRKKKNSSRRYSARDVARLDVLKRETVDGSKSAIEQLEITLEESRQLARTEIKRLQQQLQDRRKRANDEMAALAQQREDIRATTQRELGTMDLQKAESVSVLVETLRDLGARQAQGRRRLEEENAELKQRRKDIRRARDEELARLDAMEADISVKREQGIAGIQEADAQLLKKTKKALKHLQTLEVEARRQQAEATNDSASGQPGKDGGQATNRS